MLEPVHAEITHQALGSLFSANALKAILRANLGQDGLHGQVGHDEYHFDNNAFEKSRVYLEGQRALTIRALQKGQPSQAWSAFGRLTHTAQDFYAHTNYVTLWLARIGDSALPAPTDIDPMDARLINSPDLRSGILYYPREILYFIPGLRKFALSFLPRDSHAHMNLDSAGRGPNFEYAFQAALKRTQYEFEQVKVRLSKDQLSLFMNT
jgi:hypothetical protein